jgi:hypothetical protein
MAGLRQPCLIGLVALRINLLEQSVWFSPAPHSHSIAIQDGAAQGRVVSWHLQRLRIPQGQELREDARWPFCVPASYAPCS